ncbi:Lactate utilization protein A [Planctomycetes bacterium Pan216]|uniref:Glycolate oxidase iron-sulfur subunit n=1 Tax=Kolteria novifilia TaxID=2527975 RepID=A0A518AZF1_9BACT|nr:Lactate utilization protein A [Planctomycetes bacterium Pan216]
MTTPTSETAAQAPHSGPESPATSLPLPVLDQPEASAVEYERFLDCVHCGLCTSSCPTYLELGTEMDSPRGRIHLMRAVTDGRLPLDNDVKRHLDLCLDCRSCETACPSGVQYGRIIEPFRLAMEKQSPAPKSRDWFHRWILFGILADATRTRWALAPVRLMQWLGLDRLLDRSGLVRFLPGKLQRMHRMLPRLEPRGPELPERLAAIGPKRATVALSTGCVADAVFHHVHWATIRVLRENGCDVLIPRSQTCCGAIHFHAGAEEPAIERAKTNLAAFPLEELDAVIVNVAGCGAMLKEYGHLPVNAATKERLQLFASKVRDIHEFLVDLGPIAPKGELNWRVAYHDACHLCHAQKITEQPRELLRLIPGLELVAHEEPTICCGAAGSYNLVEAEMAERLVARKADHLLAVEPDAIAIPNAGCLLHMGRRIREEVDGEHAAPWMGHPIELLDRSYQASSSP